MSRTAVIAFVACFALLAFGTFGRKSTYVVEKKELISAPPETVFALINDFHQWPEWSPWEAYDLKMKHTFEGSAFGVGAKMGWAGTGDVGEGTMTISASDAPKRVAVDVAFTTPSSLPGELVFTLTPTPFGTETSWTWTGHHTLGDKISSLVITPSSLVGRELESGLSNLKAAAEKRAKAAAPAPVAPAADADGGVADATDGGAAAPAPAVPTESAPVTDAGAGAKP